MNLRTAYAAIKNGEATAESIFPEVTPDIPEPETAAPVQPPAPAPNAKTVPKPTTPPSVAKKQGPGVEQQPPEEAPAAPLNMMADRNAAVCAVLVPADVTMKSLNEHLRRTGAIAESAHVVSTREDTEAFLAHQDTILEAIKQEGDTTS